jgi:hypothetical protein
MDFLDREGNPIACLMQLHTTEEGIARILKELEDSLKGKKGQRLKPLNDLIAEAKGDSS